MAALTELLRQRDERIQLLWDEARRLAAYFVSRGVASVWVFGSLAVGRAHSQSDLDLAVVWDTEVRPLERALVLLDGLDPRVAVDLLVMTPRELELLDAGFLERAVRIDGLYGS